MGEERGVSPSGAEVEGVRLASWSSTVSASSNATPMSHLIAAQTLGVHRGREGEGNQAERQLGVSRQTDRDRGFMQQAEGHPPLVVTNHTGQNGDE